MSSIKNTPKIDSDYEMIDKDDVCSANITGHKPSQQCLLILSPLSDIKNQGEKESEKPALTTTKTTDSQSYDEAHAFKSQFEEINLILAKWSECPTSNRTNYHYSNNNIASNNSNHHHRFQGGRGAANSQLPLLTTSTLTQTIPQRKTNHDAPIFNHHRTGSHPIFTTPRQRVLKHHRSSSSISQFHYLTNNHIQPHHQYQQHSSSRSSSNYDKIHAQEPNDFLLNHYLSGSKSIGNGDGALWEPLSTAALRPGDTVDSFIPLPMNPRHHHSTVPYSHEISYSPPSLLNDEELLQKQLQLQAQKEFLDNAIAANRKLMNETTHVIGSSHLSTHSDVDNGAEAIRKDHQKSSGRSSPNSSLSSSNPSPSGFSLFAQSPTVSLNPNNGSHRRHNSINSNQSDNFSPIGAFPLTPVSTPPKDDEDGYFSSLYFSNRNRGQIISSPVQEIEEEECLWDQRKIKNDDDAFSFELFDQQKSYSSAPGDIELDHYHVRSAALNRSRTEREPLSNSDRFSHNRSSRLSSYPSNSTPPSNNNPPSTLDGSSTSSSIMGRRNSEAFLRLALGRDFGNSLPTHREIQDDGFGNGTSESQKQHTHQQQELNRDNIKNKKSKSLSSSSFYYDSPYYLRESMSTSVADLIDSNITNNSNDMTRSLYTSGSKTAMMMRNPLQQQEKQEQQNSIENMLPMFYYEKKSGGNDEVGVDSQQLLASGTNNLGFGLEVVV
ncbi:2837_t:CDS:2 [Ambispora leptoticha]|uniref:2837_t:CDS:1 n=1 Tax=Ambispora leptoticha TaxID=144679 RepID=A0A9N8Z687_9GLOM|nr:2837_t:CDS:2 [Ambispora leptoticha]